MIAQTMSQTKLCMDMLHITEVVAIFVIFLHILAKKMVGMGTSLRPLQSEMSSLDWPITKNPVISNRILVIS